MTKLSPRLATILQWCITLPMPLFLLLGVSLYIVMTPQFIQWEYSQPGFPLADLFTPEARSYNSVQTVRYVRGEISEQDLINLKVYNDREIKHLVDVYKVSQTMFLIVPLALAIMGVALYILLRAGRLAHAGRGMAYGGILSFVVIGAIGLFAVFAFDSFFVTFHHLLFEGDSWLFFTTDSLIQFYPEVFWMTASYAIAGMVLLSAVILTAIGGYLIRRGTQRAA